MSLTSKNTAKVFFDMLKHYYLCGVVVLPQKLYLSTSTFFSFFFVTLQVR